MAPNPVGSSGAPASRTCTPPTVRGGSGSGRRSILSRVRLTHFRRLMDDEFGAIRAGSIARDHVFAALGNRTVEEALEAGIDPRDVWRAVCTEFEVPAERR